MGGLNSKRQTPKTGHSTRSLMYSQNLINPIVHYKSIQKKNADHATAAHVVIAT